MPRLKRGITGDAARRRRAEQQRQRRQRLRDEKMGLEKLIAAVKKYELLYNPCNPDYKDIPMRRQIWNSIAKEVNMSDSECQTKWKNLRDTFVRKINQQKNPKMTTGRGRDYMRWRYYKQLTFLMPYVHPRMPFQYLRTQAEYPDEYGDSSKMTNVDGLFDVMIEGVSSDDDCPVRAPILLQLKKEVYTSSEDTPVEQQTCDPVPVECSASPTSALAETTASPTLAEKSEEVKSPEKSSDVRDDVYYFTNFVAERLRSLSPRRRDAKMRNIFTALFANE